MNEEDMLFLRSHCIDFVEIDRIEQSIRASVLKEAAERAVGWLCEVPAEGMTAKMVLTLRERQAKRLRAAILGDHVSEVGVPGQRIIRTLDPEVQAVVQDSFWDMAGPDEYAKQNGSNELLKQAGVTYKTTMLEPPDASFDCPTCAESVDGKPGNSAGYVWTEAHEQFIFREFAE